MIAHIAPSHSFALVWALLAPPSPESEPDRTRLAEVVQPTMLVELAYTQRGDETEGTSGFSIPRGRMGLRITPTRWMTAVATAELVGEHGPYLLDAFASFEAAPWVQVNAGYAKAPLFPSFRYEPVAALPMPLRSPVVNAFRVRRDAGAEVRLRPRRVPIETLLRVGNGSGGLQGNDDALPTGYAAFDLVLGRAWAGGRNETLGLRVGAASMLDAPEDHDAAEAETPLGFAYVRPVVAQGLRSVSEAHVLTWLGPVRLVVEGAFAHESRREDGDGDATTPRTVVDPVQSWGLTGEVAWTLRGQWRQPGRAPQGPENRGERWDGGAVELSARADRLWVGLGTPEVPNGGGTTGSAALKWWPTTFTSLALYGDSTRFDAPTAGHQWSWSAMVRGSVFWGPGSRGIRR